MDILERLVTLAQVSGRVNIKCQFQGQWQLDHQAVLPQNGSLQGLVHIVTKGSGYLHWQNEAKIQPLVAGDVIFFPRELAHSLSSTQVLSNEKQIQASQQGAFMIKQNAFASEPDFSLFCANFRYEPDAELIKHLPEMLLLHLTPEQLAPLVNLLQWEVEQQALGGELVTNALATVLLVYLLRAYLQTEQNLSGIFKGLQHKRLSLLLHELINHPEQRWTMEEMVNVAHLSRSQVIRLFQQNLNETPHAFLHKIRLQKAALLLKQNADSILAIALATGFQSETHFGKAFKKKYGITPSAYRKITISKDEKSSIKGLQRG